MVVVEEFESWAHGLGLVVTGGDWIWMLHE